MDNNTNFDAYPVVLQAHHIKSILGISTGMAYNLLNSENFPTIRLGGKRKIVLKDEFIIWLKDDRHKIKRIPIITV